MTTTNIITGAFIAAIEAVEQGPPDNPFNFTRPAWEDAMAWRREHHQTVWPYERRGNVVIAGRAARALCEVNWHRLTQIHHQPAPADDIHKCRAMMYAMFWKGCKGYLDGISDKEWERCKNVANYAEKPETA